MAPKAVAMKRPARDTAETGRNGGHAPESLDALARQLDEQLAVDALRLVFAEIAAEERSGEDGHGEPATRDGPKLASAGSAWVGAAARGWGRRGSARALHVARARRNWLSALRRVWEGGVNSVSTCSRALRRGMGLASRSGLGQRRDLTEELCQGYNNLLLLAPRVGLAFTVHSRFAGRSGAAFKRLIDGVNVQAFKRGR
eukprot:CAMPEP_0202055404 /NCGR_PEP_ID=MMETSP0963-20130614/18250_1 /ASSEMBLY_ACC=CAM_ASM_000494 /TAXON_ID=4773 /ORGANISM="Schizochytrium aggregatum, Strain ATCC28209" /LENGTH=199 /DNA_ID=CAMNT_0048621005 /DNA_START=17 /DNA_END=614 /DNA_ORIENTATION=+